MLIRLERRERGEVFDEVATRINKVILCVLYSYNMSQLTKLLIKFRLANNFCVWELKVGTHSHMYIRTQSYHVKIFETVT